MCFIGLGVVGAESVDFGRRFDAFGGHHEAFGTAGIEAEHCQAVSRQAGQRRRHEERREAISRPVVLDTGRPFRLDSEANFLYCVFHSFKTVLLLRFIVSVQYL